MKTDLMQHGEKLMLVTYPVYYRTGDTVWELKEESLCGYGPEVLCAFRKGTFSYSFYRKEASKGKLITQQEAFELMGVNRKKVFDVLRDYKE